METCSLTAKEFTQFRSFFYQIAGIDLSPTKKPMVMGRLAKQLKRNNLSSYGEYFELLYSGRDPGETQRAVDLLTTNETYFFRESKHFEFLRERILAGRRPGKPFRIWSAASSTGQEAYSIAMVLADVLGEHSWEVVASDISTRVLEIAREAQYNLSQAEKIPRLYLYKYCLKGIGRQEGTFRIDRSLRSRVNFMQINLNTPLPKLGEFDVVFLRNVMIYFDNETKRQVVNRIGAQLKSGGHLIIGHSESLNGIENEFKSLMPSIYYKP